MKEFPQYKCSKIVGGLKITRIEEYSDSRSILYFDEDEGYDPYTVTNEWVAGKKAVVGGYLVKYDDGYLSFSPQVQFENGYTRIYP